MSANTSDKSTSHVLTARQREIVRLLAKTARNPIPVGAISEKQIGRASCRERV